MRKLYSKYSLRLQGIAGGLLLLLFFVGFESTLVLFNTSSTSLVHKINKSVEEILLGLELNLAVQEILQMQQLYIDGGQNVHLIEAQRGVAKAKNIIHNWQAAETEDHNIEPLASSEEIKYLNTFDTQLGLLNLVHEKLLKESIIQNEVEKLLPLIAWEGWVTSSFRPQLAELIHIPENEIKTYSYSLLSLRQSWSQSVSLLILLGEALIILFFVYVTRQNLRLIRAIEKLASEYALGYFDTELDYAPGEFAKLAIALKGMAMALKRSTVDRDMVTSIMNSQLDMVFVFDKHLRLEFANQTATKSLNTHAGLLPIGSSFHYLFDIDKDEGGNIISELVATPTSHWHMWNTRFGEVIEVSASVWQGSIARDGFIVVVRNITEQEELRKRNLHIEHEAMKVEIRSKEMEVAVNTRHRFMTNMSHELRTPLHGILGLVELLEHSSLTENQSLRLIQLRKTGKHMLQLINDILDVSKLESSQYQFESREIDLVDIIEDVLDNCASKAYEVDLTLVQDVNYTRDWIYLGDEQRIRQVLLNLVSNAIKFTLRGHVVLSLRQSPSDGVIFQIIDTGIGIAKNKQQFIFEPFNQEDDSTTRRFGGTGLGLTIVKQITDAMGGHITLESTAGLGAAFTVHLPLQRVEKKQINSQVNIIRPNPPAGAVLVITENSIFYRACEMLLESFGQKTVYSSNIEKALKVLSSDEALSMSTCLIDWHLMQDNNNTVSWREIKNHFPALNMIAMGPGSKTEGSLASLTLPINRNRFYRCLWPDTASGLLVADTLTSQNISPSSLTGKRILVAEDNQINQQYATAILESMGAAVVITATGSGAVSLFQENSFDLILMDGQMPEMDGYQATRRIRQLEAVQQKKSPIPIVALTAHAMAEDRQYCLDAGMNDYLSKPFNRMQLFTVIQRWITVSSEKIVDGNKQIPITDLKKEATMIEANFDKSRLDMIRQLQQPGKPSVLDGFINSFLKTTPQALVDLGIAHQVGDFSKIGFIAHKLKSGSATLGLLALADICKDLEKLPTTSPSLEEVSRLLTDLDGAYTVGVNWLHGQMTSPPVS